MPILGSGSNWKELEEIGQEIEQDVLHQRHIGLRYMENDLLECYYGTD